MKINFVAYLNPNFYKGGGEAINKKLIDTGIQRGHDIRITSFRPFRVSFHSRPKLTIFSDLTNSTAYPKKLSLLKFPIALLKFLKRNSRVLYLSNAYTNLCDEPYLPCNGNSSPICPFSKNVCFSHSKYVEEVHSLTENYIFLSPLHKNISENLLKNANLNRRENSILLSPFIDTKTFHAGNDARDIKYLFVGVIGEAKGLTSYENSKIKSEITYIGKKEAGVKVSGDHRGVKPYAEVAEIMRRSEEFVFWPRWPEPQGRVVVEAALSGCILNCNENVGALSYGVDYSDPKTIENAENDAWSEIECLV